MMRSILHILAGLLLSLSLLVSGLASASAGVSMALAEGGSEIAICGDGGASVISLDALGRVVEPRKTCDRCMACALATAANTPSPILILRPATPLRGRVSHFLNTPDIAVAYLRPCARAPPARA